MKNKLYQIGNYVLVFKTTIRVTEGSRRIWRKAMEHISTEKRLGQIVGLTTRYDGVCDADYDEGYVTYRYFVPHKAHQLWLVRFGLSNKPVCVAEEDMRLAVWGEIHELPYSYPPRKMSEDNKRCLRGDSVHWPRDAKGRWMKGPVTHG